MSTFPQKCPDGDTPSLPDVYRGIQENTAELNNVLRVIVESVNRELQYNQLDIDCCCKKLKKHISSETQSNKKELTKLADELMEVILHGVADVTISGDSSIRNIDSATATPGVAVKAKDTGTASGVQKDTSTTVDESTVDVSMPGESGPPAIVGGNVQQPGSDSQQPAQPPTALPLPGVLNVQIPNGLQAASATVVAVVGPNGQPMGSITINITVLPAPVTIIPASMSQALNNVNNLEAFPQAPPTGGTEAAPFNPAMFGDTAEFPGSIPDIDNPEPPDDWPEIEQEDL